MSENDNLPEKEGDPSDRVAPAKEEGADDGSKMTTVHANGGNGDKFQQPQPPQWMHDFYLPPSPDVIPLAAGQRLVAVGDIHGNWRLLTDILRAAKLIRRREGDDDDVWTWCGGTAICVQVGDLLDRGYQEEECILLLTKLARQAQQAGGAVVVLWGNHEVCQSIGDFTCTQNYDGFEETFGPILDEWNGNKPDVWRELYRQNASFRNKTGYAARFAAFEPGGPLAVPFLSNLKVAVQVGRTVLVHAGLRADHLQKQGGIQGMNQMARDWALTKVVVPETKDADLEQTAASRRAVALDASVPAIFENFISTGDGPIWMRDYSRPPNREPTKEAVAGMVDAVLRELDGVDRLVVGHTVQEGVNSVLDGKVWRIDVGMGIHREYMFSSCLESHMKISKIALQIFNCENGKEKVEVVQRTK